MKARIQRWPRRGLLGRNRLDEVRRLAMLRTRLLEMQVPADSLTDDELREGVRRVTRALDTGRLTPDDITTFRASASS